MSGAAVEFPIIGIGPAVVAAVLAINACDRGLAPLAIDVRRREDPHNYRVA